MPSPTMPPDAIPAASRAARTRRTALWLGAVAVAIYIAFILSGVLAR